MNKLLIAAVVAMGILVVTPTASATKMETYNYFSMALNWAFFDLAEDFWKGAYSPYIDEKSNKAEDKWNLVGFWDSPAGGDGLSAGAIRIIAVENADKKRVVLIARPAEFSSASYTGPKGPTGPGKTGFSKTAFKVLSNLLDAKLAPLDDAAAKYKQKSGWGDKVKIHEHMKTYMNMMADSENSQTDCEKTFHCATAKEKLPAFIDRMAGDATVEELKIDGMSQGSAVGQALAITHFGKTVPDKVQFIFFGAPRIMNQDGYNALPGKKYTYYTTCGADALPKNKKDAGKALAPGTAAAIDKMDPTFYLPNNGDKDGYKNDLFGNHPGRVFATCDKCSTGAFYTDAKFATVRTWADTLTKACTKSARKMATPWGDCQKENAAWHGKQAYKDGLNSDAACKNYAPQA